MSTEDNHTELLLEDLYHQNLLILEIVSSMQDEMKTFAKQKDLAALRDEVHLIRTALVDTNGELRSHDERIIRLEQAVLTA